MSIQGKIEAIISPSSTEENTVITLPFSSAESIYFKDGDTLENKYNNGELGSSSSTVTSSSNKWKGKRIYCFGDSITAGSYPSVMQNILGAYVTNKGSSGGTYARDYDIISSIDLTYADCITIMTGHNAGAGTTTLDTSGLLSLSSVNDYSSYPSNYYGGIGKIIAYVRNTYPNIKIYLCNLHWTKRGTTSKDCKRALIEIGEYYSVPVIDVYSNCGVCATNIDTYSSDGTHLDLLNSKGQTMLGECISYQMMYL